MGYHQTKNRAKLNDGKMVCAVARLGPVVGEHRLFGRLARRVPGDDVPIVTHGVPVAGPFAGRVRVWPRGRLEARIRPRLLARPAGLLHDLDVLTATAVYVAVVVDDVRLALGAHGHAPIVGRRRDLTPVARPALTVDDRRSAIEESR